MTDLQVELLERYTDDFVPSLDRILAAILTLMKWRPGISQFQIVKPLFIADKKHLNESGRPVTYDRYVAMEQGPVPSLAYDLLMKPEVFQTLYGRPPPWSVETRSRGHRFTATEGPDEDSLSRTDLAALREGVGVVDKLNKIQLSELLHKDPAWVEAWGRRGNARKVPMRAVKLLEDEDEEAIANLRLLSRS